MDLTGHLSSFAGYLSSLAGRLPSLAGYLPSLAGHLSFLVQWSLYRVVAALEPLRNQIPGLGRDETLWVFGARGGEAFADNSKYLYLHVAAECPEIRPVWLSKDRAVVADLQSAGYEAYHCYSLRGLLLNLRAGVVFLTQGHRDLAMPACGGAFAVLLWHGVPIKHISWDSGFRDEPAPIRAAHADMADEFDLLTIPGEALADLFASGLRIDRDRMAVVGYPRNDALFGEVPGESVGADAAALERVRGLAADHRVVFYLPTFREGASASREAESKDSKQEPNASEATDSSVADHLDFEALDAFLAERDAYFVVKTHPKERLDLPAGLSRVVQLPEATDPYPFLRHADALVTDYSSVYFDYLLLDRPVVFYPYDLDRYRARRGFYFDYQNVTPGPVARTFDELLAGLDRALDEIDASQPDTGVSQPDAEAPQPDARVSESNAGASESHTDDSRRIAVRERLLDGDSAVTGDGASRWTAGTSRSAAVCQLVRRAIAESDQETAGQSRTK